MEGLGYWFFLGIIYLLSALLKKRQQKASKNKQNLDDNVESDWAPPEFLKNILSEFKDQKNDLFSENDEASVIIDNIPEEFQENDEIQRQIKEDPEIEIFEPTSIRKSGAKIETTISARRHTVDDYKIERKKNIFHDLFQNRDQLRQAIVLKEILDKPQALKRRLR